MSDVLLDTNLLLLLVVGQANRNWIKTHKRLSAFDEIDFGLLRTRLSQFSGLVTLPNILTEASNLLPVRAGVRQELAASHLARFAMKAREIYVPSEEVVKTREFLQFGLTDTAILRIRYEQITVMTVDNSLIGILSKLGVTSINLRHDRTPQIQ